MGGCFEGMHQESLNFEASDRVGQSVRCAWTDILGKVSLYRAELMAMAMIGILFTHFKAAPDSFIVRRLMLFGQGGVDMFFFLSGFGLYYSSLKHSSPLCFYKRRLLRIFPAFILVLFISLLAKPVFSWRAFLWGSTTLPFWLPSIRKYTFGWYVSVIMLLYAIFPAYISFFRKGKHWCTGISVAMALGGVAIYAHYFLHLHPGAYNQYILCLARLPIFFLGIYAGSQSVGPRFTEADWGGKVFWIVLPLAAATLWNVGLTLWGFMPMRNSGLLYLLFCPILPGLMLIMTWGFGWLKRRVWLNCSVGWMLRQMGTCTLEAYLLLGITYRYVNPVAHSLGITPFWANVVLAIATILCAWLLHRGLEIIPSWVTAWAAKRKDR